MGAKRRTELQYNILQYLRQHGSGATPTYLAEDLYIFRSSVSRALHTLKRDGLVFIMGKAWFISAMGCARLDNSFRLATDIDWKWGDTVFGILCPCGQEVIVNTESDTYCGCGRIYRAKIRIEVMG